MQQSILTQAQQRRLVKLSREAGRTPLRPGRPWPKKVSGLLTPSFP